MALVVTEKKKEVKLKLNRRINSVNNAAAQKRRKKIVYSGTPLNDHLCKAVIYDITAKCPFPDSNYTYLPAKATSEERPPRYRV